MSSTTAREWLDLVLEGWSLLFEDVVSGDPLGFPGYPEQLRAAREKTGCTESVLVAEGTIGGASTIVISFEFSFLGGSMGVAAGERICRAFERAAERRIPVVALTASGGARMQEGMLALAQMPATLVARAKLAAAHQAFVCYLRNPTTGGVYASFASSADLLWAGPGATIGFAGPRVAETVTGEPLPEGSHTAESAYDACLVDELVEPDALRARIGALTSSAGSAEQLAPDETVHRSLDPWARVELARLGGRPTGSDFVDVVYPFRRGGCDESIIAGIAKVGSRSVVVIAQNRRNGHGRTMPAGFRRARRAIAIAERLGLPIVTFIDTPGADPSAPSEGAGVAHEISATFAALLAARVPTMCVVVGEGGSGGALALAACDRILILENAIFSVIAPEGAAAILRRSDIATIAGDLKLTASDLRDLGIADHVLPEPAGGAHEDPAAARRIVEAAIRSFLQEEVRPPTTRRLERWRVFR
jgi:acetyl-CoA carboxylase carboxyl transferase beta subunit/acetyl-CoA carboxylase carboxyl transferase alpha subunit